MGHEHMIQEQLEQSKAGWADDRAWVEQVQIDLNDQSTKSLEDQARLSEIRFDLCEERAEVLGPLLRDASSFLHHETLGPRFLACMQSVDDVYEPTIRRIDALLGKNQAH